MSPGLGQRAPPRILAETQVANKKFAENGKELDGSVVALSFLHHQEPLMKALVW